MERTQRARCSGRGGRQGRSHQEPASPTSPSRCTMQLRDPSVRKPSKHCTDAFEWSPNSKGNRRNSTSSNKKLVIHLERIPESAYKDYSSPSEPPKLQHYLQDAEENKDIDHAPPNLIPEVIVTRDEKSKQKHCDLDSLPGKSTCEPSLSNKASGSQVKTKDIISGGSQPLKSSPQSKTNQRSEDNDDQETEHHSHSVVDSHLHPFVPHEFSGKRNMSDDSSPLQEHNKEEDDVESTGGWSDMSEELFEEPQRISTGKEQVETVDGIDFLTFENEEDMLEFTAIEMDHIHAPPPISCDELSAAIVPTKTHDITKIKGWRTKYFAGNNYYNSDYESCVFDLDDDLSGKEELDISPGTVSSSHRSVSEHDGVRKPVTAASQGSQETPLEDVTEGKMSIHKSNNGSSVAKGIGSTSNLDETWVKFAVSALVVPVAADSGKGRRPTSEVAEELTGRRQQQGNKKKISKLEESRTKLGRPALFPLSPYMQKKMKLIRESYKKKPTTNNLSENNSVIKSETQLQYSSKSMYPSNSNTNNNRVKYSFSDSVKSMVYNADSNLNSGKIVPASDECKIKTNRELKKLGHVVIDVDQNRRTFCKPSTSQSSSLHCSNEFCKLGCVCSSLETLPQPQGHCGRAECMFECTCSDTMPNLAVERLIEDEKRDLAPAEKDFRNAVITGGDGIVMVKQRGRREIKMPGRFRDDNMLTGDALVAVIDNRGFRTNKSPGKSSSSKSIKEVQSVPTYGKPRVKKSILQNCNNSQQNYKSNNNPISVSFNEHIGQYCRIPSPERLEEPSSRKTSLRAMIGSSPLFNCEGGFISVHKEEQFMAHHRKIKQEKPDEDETAIEIDDMGWQSLEAEVNATPVTADTREAESQDFGKIISVKSLAPEEFAGMSEEACVKSALEDKNIEHLRKPKKPLAPGISSQQRALAKIRAKNLVEFFISNATVSSLVKSAFEFKPSVLEREAITLLQWSSLKTRFQERKIHLWIREKRQDFHFLVTERETLPLPGYINLRKFSVKDRSIPLVARELLQNYTNYSDYHRCCIFWCNGMHWEFIGCLLKTAAGVAVPSVLSNESKPKVITTHQIYGTLPKDIIPTKWYSIAVGNDFEALELRHENLHIPYGKLSEAISSAWRHKSPVCFDISKAIQNSQSMMAPFGLYGLPTEYAMVYLGPYDLSEHPLLELVPYEGSICKSKISTVVNLPEKMPDEDSEYSSDDQSTGKSTPHKSDSDHPKHKEESELKGICSRLPLVTSKGRTRKIPKHLLDDMLDDDSLPPVQKKPKKTIYQVESIEIPVMMPAKKSKKVNKKQRRTSSKDDAEMELEDEIETKFVADDFNSMESSRPTSQEISDIEDFMDEDEDLDNEDKTQDSESELEEEPAEHHGAKTKKEVKPGTFAKLVCNEEEVQDVLIIVYSNESIRYRNPFGVRVVHFENLDLAIRFLNYLFKDKFPAKTLTWTKDSWPEMTEELEFFYGKLQTARVSVHLFFYVKMWIKCYFNE